MAQRNVHEDGALEDFEHREITLDGVSKTVHVAGDGPAVIIMTEMRVDKWLWAARFFKSRTLAAAACDGGKVDVNDQGVKPSRMVRPGDRLTIPTS